MRFALLVVVVACATPRHVAAQVPAGHGVIGGRFDDTPGEAAPGVTIVATSPALQQEEVVITDENGAYRLELPAGTYKLTAYYNDETLELGPVAVRANATTTQNAMINPVARCGAERHRRVAGTQAERDAVVTAVLERFARNRDTMPGSDQLPKRGILVEVAPGPSHPISLGALPVAHPIFIPATLELLQKEADRRENPVAYVRFYEIGFAGDCALVRFGIAIAGGQQCCAATTAIYQLTDDRAVLWPRASLIVPL